ncbi:carboxypeptidase-like regulatory domain-containing protein [Jejuia pallidilutea]|uniref:TonB-dependent receptor putative n=1 Tax=Jejuia pallidilutea TaxID=504487 RepID=A0A090W0Q8_9FLAO|nr:TonB-dependent receptor putative [Jejuia pallidilutea]
MKHFISLSILLFAFFSLSAYANTPEPNDAKKGTVFGKVLDAKLKQPLPYVNVIIKDTKGKTLTGGITLDDGSFKIEKIEEGSVTVSIQYIGYKTFNKTIVLKKGNYNVNIGNIYLEEEAEV